MTLKQIEWRPGTGREIADELGYIGAFRVAELTKQSVRMGDPARWVVRPAIGKSFVADSVEEAKARVQIELAATLHSLLA
jgi:hypothetical protein